MPANVAAARVTDAWRQWLDQLARGLRRQAAADLAELNLDPDPSDAAARWLDQLAPLLLAATDAAAARARSYIISYLVASGLPTDRTALPVTAVDQLTPDDARSRLDTARVGMLWRLGRGDGRPAARGTALALADRLMTSTVYDTARAGERAAMSSTAEVVGYRRVTSGSPCGACLALSSQRRRTDEGLDVHDRCSCSAEPILRAVREQVLRPTGQQRVDAMSDEQLARTFRGGGGADKAAVVRSQGVEALVAYSGEQLVEAPLQAIT